MDKISTKTFTAIIILLILLLMFKKCSKTGRITLMWFQLHLLMLNKVNIANLRMSIREMRVHSAAVTHFSLLYSRTFFLLTLKTGFCCSANYAHTHQILEGCIPLINPANVVGGKKVKCGNGRDKLLSTCGKAHFESIVSENDSHIW